MVHRPLAFDVETVTSRHVNRTAPEGVQGLLKGITAMDSEIPENRYRRQAAECARNAAEAMKAADRLAWLQLAEDWTKLARAAEVNPRLITLEESTSCREPPRQDRS